MPTPYTTETLVRVRYAETDAMGVVYHTNYLIWFEVGRVDYMRQLGTDYASVEADGHYFAVSDVGARFIAPAHFGDEVIVRTWIDEIRSRGLTFRYEILHGETRQLLCTGFTRHICLDRSGKVTSLPADVRVALQAAQEGLTPCDLACPMSE